MISGINETKSPWVMYHWVVQTLRLAGLNENYIERMVAKPDVPRGTCATCGQRIPPQKVKHKEVFEEVVWTRNVDKGRGAMYPYFDKNPDVFHKLEYKTTKLTIEWEE